MGKDKGKKGSVDPHKFEGAGVDFKSKLIGITEVSAPRGDDITQEAIAELKAAAIKNNREKKEHKQRITLNVTLKGIRLIDEATERIDYAHPIHRISFISHAKDDKRSFGYIVGTKDGYKLFAIRTVKEAEQITKTLKELFQEVFARHQAKKNKEEQEEIEEAEEVVEEKEENGNDSEEQVDGAEEEKREGSDDSQIIWDELNDQIQEMQTVISNFTDSTAGIPHSDSFDLLTDDLPLDEKADTKENQDPFDDNFRPDPTSTQKSLPYNAFEELRKDSLSNNEKVDFFSLPKPEELKRNISNNDFLPVETSDTIEDLYAIPNPPARKDREIGTTVTETPLMKYDPFDDLKKNINELHKQNIIVQQQQQQQQQQLVFTSAFPQASCTPFQMNMQPNANPFLTSNSYTGTSQPPPVPVRPAPLRSSSTAPTVTNPFLQPQQQPSNQINIQQNMGWSVIQPTPLPANVVVKPKPTTDDPFSFLDDQTGSKPISQPMAPVNQYTANNELLDLLG